MFLFDITKKTWIVTSETVSSFRRNDGLAAASSLAFSAMLAIIPALFLLTVLLGMTIGSSQEAFLKVKVIAEKLFPDYSQVIVKEVQYVTRNVRTFGAVNFLVFLFFVTPLVSDLRQALSRIFRLKPGRPFLLEKLLDVVITVVFLLGITAVTAAGVAFSIAGRWLPLPELPAYLGGIVQYLFVAATVFLLYFIFSGKDHPLHLAAGAVAAASLWFVMRPLFHEFLAYNPGYGLAFGSFKSLFVVIIWIYYTLVVFLAGAEVAASLGRHETIFLKHLMSGKRSLPAGVAERFVTRYQPGETIFVEGDAGDRMYSVTRGTVSVLKAGKVIATVGAGQYFGVVSFLLETPRIASAVARDEVELVMITRKNINDLTHESPEFILAVLKETALRLQETNRLLE
jgi:YihY family inner membrane protein